MRKGILYSFYYAVLLGTTLLLTGCPGGAPAGKNSIPNLRETYRKDDKLPFGGYVAFQMLEQLFPDNIRRTKKEPIEKTWAEVSDTNALYISISRNLYTSDEDVTSIREFVSAGNDLFLSAASFDNNLLEEIDCKVANSGELLQMITGDMKDTRVRLKQRPGVDTSSYSYFYKPFTNYFYGFDTNHTRVIGYNNQGDPNCIVHFEGRGRLFLHCDPRAFSNYFLLQRDNYRYMQSLMGYVHNSPQHLYWNDYYVNVRQKQSGGGSGRGGGSGSRRNRSSSNEDDSGSTLSGLKGPLWTAFWLILGLLLLYILYGMKRRQRQIPQKKPNENTSVTFTETIGLLYLQKKDNRNIADKMITYFNEFVRNQYFLNTNHVTPEFITTLSRKSGVQQGRVESLYRAIAHAQQSTHIDDYQLLSLSQLIQNFYKYRN